MRSVSDVVASAVRGGLVCLADWLCFCAHRRTTFPVTLRASVLIDGRRRTQPETYMACLECGRHLPYDWTAMRVAGRRGAPLVPQTIRLEFPEEVETDGGSR